MDKKKVSGAGDCPPRRSVSRPVPIYEYQCPDCGARFGRLRPMQERDEPIRCPECASERARRVVSVVAAARCAPEG
ncbi:MAG: FmdB family zinc ribbon protein [Armatimonadota bacterium]